MEEAFKRVGYGFNLHTLPGKRALFESNEGHYDGEALRIYALTADGKYPNLFLGPKFDEPSRLKTAENR